MYKLYAISILLLLTTIGCGMATTTITQKVPRFDFESGTTRLVTIEHIEVVSRHDAKVIFKLENSSEGEVNNQGKATLIEGVLTEAFMNTEVQIGDNDNDN